MSSKLVAFFLLMVCLSVASFALASSWFLYGTVTWNPTTVAAGVEIRLLQNGEKKAVAYTNQEGRYGFPDVPGEPSHYTMEIWANKKKVKEQSLSGVERGKKYNINLQ